MSLPVFVLSISLPGGFTVVSQPIPDDQIKVIAKTTTQYPSRIPPFGLKWITSHVPGPHGRDYIDIIDLVSDTGEIGLVSTFRYAFAAIVQAAGNNCPRKEAYFTHSSCDSTDPHGLTLGHFTVALA